MKFSFTLLCIMFYSCVHAQVVVHDSVFKKPLSEARQYLTGIGKVKNKEKAVEIYLQCANMGSVKAMNAVGYFYSKGIGIEQNQKKAVEWLTKAANAGNGEAWYHLGMFYKDGIGVAQDYSKAYKYFKKSAQLSNAMGLHLVGYMHYKGLGCNQDYNLAAISFKQAAALKYPNGMYFLGLCYRNGYGVRQNSDSAKHFLLQAAKKGNSMARKELMMKSPERSQLINQSRINQFTPANLKDLSKYAKVEHNVDIQNLQGKFSGQVIKYDWSGQHIISHSNLELDLSLNNGQLVGRWIEADSLNIPVNATYTPSAIRFNQSKYKRTDHYSPNKPMEYQIQDARLQSLRKNDTVFLFGNVQMFSVERKEPERPIYVVLKKVLSQSNAITMTADKVGIMAADAITNDKKETTLNVYPNPVRDLMTLKFSLIEKADVKAQILTQDGKVVYDKTFGKLESGYHNYSIKTNQLSAGFYILRLQYGSKSKSIKVTKL